MQSHNRMKRFSLLHHTLSKMLLMLCTAGVLTACSEMKEELPACPQGLNVHFKYNYNLDRADMFRDQVGSVTVYLFDEEGHYVDQKTVSNEGDYKPLSDPNFSILRREAGQISIRGSSLPAPPRREPSRGTLPRDCALTTHRRHPYVGFRPRRKSHTWCGGHHARRQWRTAPRYPLDRP